MDWKSGVIILGISTPHPKWVGIKTVLFWVEENVIVWANFEDKVSLMVGCNIHNYRNVRSLVVSLCNNAWNTKELIFYNQWFKSSCLNGFWSLCQVLSMVPKSFLDMSTVMLRIINDYFYHYLTCRRLNLSFGTTLQLF